MSEARNDGQVPVYIHDEERAVGDFYSAHHELFEYRGKTLTGWLEKLLKSLRISPVELRDMSCMEAGGAGSRTLALAQRGFKHAHYIDLSEENIRWMRSYLDSCPNELPISVTHGSILDRHQELDRTFNLIICTGVIHHTIDPAKALMNLHAWLKTDGVLIVNCYRSGSLYFFWAYLIRELVSLIHTDYAEFAQLVDLYDFPIRKREIMDHALVPLMHPTTANTFRHDLEKLGFEVIRGDDDVEPYHSTTRAMLNFTARKVSSFDGTLEELNYHTGLNQLELDYDQECLALIDEFVLFKEKLSNTTDPKTSVILAILAITRIFNECQDIDKGLLRRLRQVQKTKDFRMLFMRSSPKDRFYRNVQRYLSMSLQGI